MLVVYLISVGSNHKKTVNPSKNEIAVPIVGQLLKRKNVNTNK